MIDLEAIFRTFLQGNNDERSQAMSYYEECVKTQTNEVVHSLIHIILQSPQENFRSMAIIYLKKLAITQGGWPRLNQESKELTKNCLLDSLKNETSVRVRSQLHDCISEIFSHVIKNNEWTDMLDKILEFIQSQNSVTHRESGFLILGQICSMEPKMMRPHLEAIKNITAIGLSDESDRVQLSAIVALSGFISASKTRELRTIFQSLIPSVIDVLNTLLNESKTSESLTVLLILNDWVEIDHLFFRPHIPLIVQTAFAICKSEIDDDVVYQAVLLLSNITSVRAKDILKVENFLSGYIEILLTMLLKIDRESLEDWNTIDEKVTLESSQSQRAESCIDDLAHAVDGNLLLPVIMEYVQFFLQKEEWNYKYSALMTLGLISEGCKAQFLHHLHDVLSFVVPHMVDQDPRVRWAATYTIGSFSNDLAPNLQHEFPDLIIPELAARLDDVNYPKIQLMSLKALRVFVQQTSEEAVVHYMDDILKKLHSLLSSPEKEILEETIAAIGAVAIQAKQRFIDYYDIFIPHIKTILENTKSPEYRLLRGRTFECISIIGLAVGKEKFYPDAREILSHIQNTELHDFGSDDSNADFILESSARICRALQEDFIPFLPIVMPIVLGLANIESENYLREYDSFPDDDEYKYKYIDGKKVGIHTGTLEVKCLACQMLYCYIDTLGEGLADYYNSIIQTFVPLLSFEFYQDIRVTCVASMHPLLESIFKTYSKSNRLDEFMNIFNTVIHELINSLLEETEISIQGLMFEAIYDCLTLLPENTVNPELVEQIIKIMITTVKEFDANRKDKIEELQDRYEDDAEEMWRERESDEELVLSNIASIAGTLSRKQMNIYLPFFEKIFDFVMELIHPNNVKSFRNLGFCIIDDAIENSDGKLNHIVPVCLPLMVDSILDESTIVAQSAAYGVGVCAHRTPDLFAQYLDVSLKHLNSVIERDTEGDIGREELRDSAINSFGKIVMYHRSDQSYLISLWLSWLPLSIEEVDACECHHNVLLFARQNNPHFWGENFSNLPKILEIFAFCIDKQEEKLARPDTVEEITNFLIDFKINNPDLLKQGIQTLNSKYQEVLSFLTH